ncbi:hypothetical protein [Mycobacterium branderi]|nr:hypothetical protein [Mycobacterium branderi]MCV7236326.1 hypothetical protein [Mycobacterium branderi]
MTTGGVAVPKSSAFVIDGAAADADPTGRAVETPVVDSDDSHESDCHRLESTHEADDAHAAAGEPATNESQQKTRRQKWSRVVGFGALPALALLLALAAGYLKWQDGAVRETALGRSQSVHAAIDSTIAMLSYRPDSVDKDLHAAQDRLTGNFRNAYSSLIDDVVIPGSRQKDISAVATVPAAASVSATGNHAVVIVFVNQTTVVGNDAPTNSASSVRVTLEKLGGQWLISDFTPV